MVEPQELHFLQQQKKRVPPTNGKSPEKKPVELAAHP
jgi:hypothetical protein